MTERFATHFASSQPTIARETVFFPTGREKESDITAFYNVENDVLFLQKYANNLTPVEQDYYLKENILGLLSEFAGKIPYRKITYLLSDKGLCYGDIRMIDMLQHTSNIAGDREAQENIGHSWVYKELEDSYQLGQPLKHTAIFSPPKNWDYGYVFYYATEFDPDLGKDVVRMHAIKYDEARHEIKNSKNILFRINPQLFYKTAREFLEVPILDLVQTPDLDTVLRAVGVSKQDVEYSHWFEDAVMKDGVILYGMSRYIQLAIELANNSQSFNQVIRAEKIDEMELLLRGIYNRARVIKEGEDKMDKQQANVFDSIHPGVKLGSDISPSAFQQIIAGYASKPAIVVGGGSCPSVSNNGSRGFLSSYQLSEGLSLGNSVESLISGSSSVENSSCSQCGKDNDSHFHCPDCGYTIPSGVGKIMCDGCGLTKEKLAARTGVSCG